MSNRKVSTILGKWDQADKMYDGIFHDFDTIKRHCRKNGNVAIEESVVFELLENLFPKYGPVQTVQMIIEMLDAQRIRDTKDSSSKSILEALNDDKSNDADSIIEVEVPHKIHPFIDLTSIDSPGSDDEVIIEKSVIKTVNRSTTESDIISKETLFDESDSDQSYQSQGLSDSEIPRQCNGDWNHTVENIFESNANLFVNLIDSSGYEQSNNSLNLNQLQANQSNFGIVVDRFAVDPSEMLEENNNDPNNNLDNRTFDEESSDLNNAVNPHQIDIQDSGNSSSNDIFVENVMTDPIPGCSRDSEREADIRFRYIESFSNNSIRVGQSKSPVPGCSKDFSISNDFELSIVNDESIQNDATCIREIVPWAHLETIITILEKHKSSPNRKQLTLWDLMSVGSNLSSNATQKRKQEIDISTIAKKVFKKDNDDFEESLLFSEFSNDSQSSKISAYNESNSEAFRNNQNNKTSLDDKSSIKMIINKEKPKIINKWCNVPNDSIKSVNNHILFDESSNLMSVAIKTEQKVMNKLSASLNTQPKLKISPYFADHSITKEKNETIVSGSLKNNSNIQTLIDAAHAVEFSSPISNNSVKERSVNISEMSNSNCKQNNDSQVDINIKKELGIATNLFTKESSKFLLPEKPEKKVEFRKRVAKELEEAANAYLGNFKEKELLNIWEKKENPSPKSDENTFLKAPRLLIDRVSSSYIHKSQAPVSTASYIRPATFTYTNTNSNMISRTTSGESGFSYQQIANDQSKLEGKSLSTGMQKMTNTIIKPPTLNMLNLIPMRSKDTMMRPVHTSQSRNNIDFDLKQENIVHINQSKPFTIFPPVMMEPPPPSKLNIFRPEATSTITSSSVTEPTVAVSQQPKHNKAISVITITTSSPNPKEVPDRSIYNKLRSMFPEVSKSYVKQICSNPPNSDDKVILMTRAHSDDKVFTLNVLIDHLLNEGHNHLQPIEDFHEQEKVTSLSVDEQYEYLLAIFPDADPTYLRSFVEKNNSEEILQQFIQQKLESHDYPTKEQYLAKIKITEQQKQYTTDFKVEKFLELFPDPFKHFEDEMRQCVYQPIAMEFLKSFFTKNRITTISRQYSTHKYNISLTAKALSIIGPDMRSRRYVSEMPTENIPLLQELAFVRNKQHIQNHINTLKTKEEKLFKELQEKNLLVTCQCCFNDECMPPKCAECNENHTFCFECIIKGTETTLANGEAHVRCFTDCTSEFSIATLQKVLPPTIFSALLKKRQAAELMAADIEGLVSCPFCHFASIPPPEDKLFKCLNPECMKETCRQCKELNHVPLRCNEVSKTDKARLLIEEKMTEALLRTCYKCERKFYKEDGCNKMTCHCGALMCYLCDKPVQNYSHFNPQGGANTHLCPLWSDDRRMNAEAVIRVAEDVKNAILKNNPNLQIDTEKLLPKLPPKTKGPHDDIPNANQMPDHIRRIAGAAP